MHKLFASIGLATLLVAGCSTPPATVFYRAEGITIKTVDSGMSAWRDYVNAGNATKAQVDLVHDAYVKYSTAQLLAKAALEKFIASQDGADQASLDAANKAMQESYQALLTLLQQFLVKH